MDIDELVKMQYKIFATIHIKLKDNDMMLDENFKKRVFENIEYMREIEQLLKSNSQKEG